MDRLESMPGLVNVASKPVFVRDSVMVSMGAVISPHVYLPPGYTYPQVTGFSLESSLNPLTLQVETGDTVSSYPPSTELAFREVHRIGNAAADAQVDQSSGATITSKNGPTLVTIGQTQTALAKDSERILTFAELGQGVKVGPIDMPVAMRSLPDISLEQAVVESVNIDGLFTGVRISTAVSSSDTTKVTVSKSRSGSSLGVTAVAVGSATVSVTGTNEAGTVTVSFNVTVTAQ